MLTKPVLVWLVQASVLHAQDRQLVIPIPVWYWPGVQLVHPVLLVPRLKLPAAQIPHALMPMLPANCPAGQAVHPPSPFDTNPGRHSAQVVAPPPENAPVGQLLHVVWPVAF